MSEFTSGQLRQHARLLRKRYEAKSLGEDTTAAFAQAELLNAQAELIEMQSSKPPTETDCTLIDDYPIIGKVMRRAGEIVNIESPWIDDHINALEKKNMSIAWEWCHDPRAGLDQGRLIRIYIGTKADGPSVVWHKDGWYTIKSRGNYGKNWACGGNWSAVDKKGGDLDTISPNIHTTIKGVIDMVNTQQTKIRQAKAKIEAATLRIRACQQADHAAASIRQANNTAYDGQDAICISNAARYEAHAVKTRAQAELVEAEAGL